MGWEKKKKKVTEKYKQQINWYLAPSSVKQIVTQTHCTYICAISIPNAVTNHLITNKSQWESAEFLQFWEEAGIFWGQLKSTASCAPAINLSQFPSSINGQLTQHDSTKNITRISLVYQKLTSPFCY